VCVSVVCACVCVMCVGVYAVCVCVCVCVCCAARSVAPEFVAPSQAQVSIMEPTAQRAPAVALARNPFQPPISSQDRVTQLTNGEISMVEPVGTFGDVMKRGGAGALGAGGFLIPRDEEGKLDTDALVVSGPGFREWEALPREVQSVIWNGVRIAFMLVTRGANDKRVRTMVSSWTKENGVSMAAFRKFWHVALTLMMRANPNSFPPGTAALLSNELEKIFKPKRRRRSTSPFTAQAQRMLKQVPRMVSGCKAFVRITKDIKKPAKRKKAM